MDYKIIRSGRKTICIQITKECEVVVRAPKKATEKRIDEFVRLNEGWISKNLSKMQSLADKRKIYTDEDIKRLKALAKDYIPSRVKYIADKTGLEYSGVKITSAKGRFGSCSPKNSLCFSLYLMDYPSEAVDYVIVHELCHTLHHNHSKKFWNAVETIMPDYKQRQKLLKNPM